MRCLLAKRNEYKKKTNLENAILCHNNGFWSEFHEPMNGITFEAHWIFSILLCVCVWYAPKKTTEITKPKKNIKKEIQIESCADACGIIERDISHGWLRDRNNSMCIGPSFYSIFYAISLSHCFFFCVLVCKHKTQHSSMRPCWILDQQKKCFTNDGLWIGLMWMEKMPNKKEIFKADFIDESILNDM